MFLFFSCLRAKLVFAKICRFNLEGFDQIVRIHFNLHADLTAGKKIGS